jgi:outer membrane protein OmpA-like peptidoglycan-associated protein
VKIDPPKKEKPERRRRSRNEVEQPKTTETYTVKRNIDVQRENPIEVVSKDLFKKQSIRFEKTIEGYTINNFSKGILEMYAQQLVLAPGLALELTAHFDNSVSQEEAVAKSSQLGEIVKQFIQSKGGDPKRINIVAVGGDYPVASNDSEQGRASNRRVEIRIIL